ncbi:MAG: hypothetical protein Q9220_004036 [cf. Caloplaca sp. 1 TL-2023]
MGAVAIWSMHYIGNRAITMLDGQSDVQIQYSAAYTAGSFFLPILVVSIAFYLLGVSETVSIFRIAVVGIFTGAAVCGMHYMGQSAIANYYVHYQWRYVLGSAVIAVTAATVALGTFFYLKATWTNSWIKRALCAALLAAAVSGMHWVATVGTVYRYRITDRGGVGLSRQATVVVVLCLAIGCCVTLISFAIIGQRVRTRSAHRAQQVVVASITFDEDGKLMVTPEGRLPCRKIAKTYLERTFDEIFDIDHPVFAWIYRASHYWPGVVDLVPEMKAHLRVSKDRKSTGSETMLASQTTLDHEKEEADFGTTFKELFCIAASELAESIQQPLENVGALFESMMFTSTFDRPRSNKLFSRTAKSDNSLSQVENGEGQPSFGRGQLLFLVRRVTHREAVRLQAAGFNFAALTNIMSQLSQTMEVSRGELSVQLHQIHRSLNSDSMLESGVHLACFALRPKFHGTWDVLINKDHKNLLPSVRLTQSSLAEWQMSVIKELDNLTARECFLHLQGRMSIAQNQEEIFLSEVERAITSLASQIDHPLFEDARLLARPFSIPCRTPGSSRSRQKATVIMFRVIADAHFSSPLNGRFEFGSSRLFRAQQHVYPRSPDHGAFARKIHLEFADLAEASAGGVAPSEAPTPRRISTISKESFPDSPTSEQAWPSTRPLAHRRSTGDVRLGTKKCKKSHALFGGIHVQHEISVDVNEVHEQDNTGPSFEMNNYEVQSEATVAPMEIDTFADELMILMMEERRQQSQRARNP